MLPFAEFYLQYCSSIKLLKLWPQNQPGLSLAQFFSSPSILTFSSVFLRSILPGDRFMQKKVLVIKLGTAVITDKEGKIAQAVIKKIAAEVAVLSRSYHVVLVSSGAVGSGKSFFKNYKGSITERKAAAAVGNPMLIQLYHKYFSKYNITVAQALCERHHFSNR